MSAYVVDVKTIERILAFIARDAEWGVDTMTQGEDAALHGAPARIASKIAPTIFTETMGYDLETEAGLQELGEALLEMNRDAVRQRYPGSESLPGPVEPQTLRYIKALSGRPVADTFKAHKSMSCLVYQCAEGDVYKRPLFKALVDYKRRIAEAYLTSRPEYRDAEGW